MAQKSGRKTMLKIADICPLAFNPIKDSFLNLCYYQQFHSTDKILIQLIATAGESISTLSVYNHSDKSMSQFSLSTYTINSSKKLYYRTLTGLNDGIYSVIINGIGQSEPFIVSSNENLLEKTALIRCSHFDNNSSFDNVWWISDVQQFIEYRIAAGLKPSGVSEKVDNEFFRDQFQTITHLYAVPYQTLILSIGNASGVPYWVGTLINRMLCISLIEIDGIKYVRSEGSIPEPTQVQEGSQLFWFAQTLELNENDIAGIGGRPQEADPAISVSFALDNPEDGDILRYSENKSAFLNTNVID